MCTARFKQGLLGKLPSGVLSREAEQRPLDFAGALAFGGGAGRNPTPKFHQVNRNNLNPYDPAGMAQSPKAPESWKYGKIPKKQYQIHHPGLAPEYTKKYTEKIQKSFLGQFRIFLIFLGDFRGPWGGGLFLFRDSGGFWALYDRNPNP